MRNSVRNGEVTRLYHHKDKSPERMARYEQDHDNSGGWARGGRCGDVPCGDQDDGAGLPGTDHGDRDY